MPTMPRTKEAPPGWTGLTGEEEQAHREFVETKVVPAIREARAQYEAQVDVQEAVAQQQFEAQLLQAKGELSEKIVQEYGLSQPQLMYEALQQYKIEVLEPWEAQQREAFEAQKTLWRAEAQRSFQTQIESWLRGMYEAKPQPAAPMMYRKDYRYTVMPEVALPQLKPPTAPIGRFPERLPLAQPEATLPAATRFPEKQIIEPIEVPPGGFTMWLVKSVETLFEKEPTTLGDILGIKHPEFLEPVSEIIGGERPWETAEEFALVPVGFVGSFERWARGDIPTPITAITQPIFERGKVTEAQFLMGHPGYAFGALIGEYVQAKAVGALISKTPLGKFEQKVYEKVVGERVRSWLTKEYLEAGPFRWRGLPEKIVMAITGEKPYLAPQIVMVPSVDVASFQASQAQATAWALAETPRTSALLVSKMPGEKLASAWVKEHLFKSVMGGISYALVEQQLKSVVEPQMPYIPTEIYKLIEPKAFLVPIYPITIKPKVAEAFVPEVLSAPQVSQFLKPRMEPIELPRLKLELVPIQVPSLLAQQIQMPIQAQQELQLQTQQVAQIQTQIQQQLQQQVQLQTTAMRTLTIPKAKVPRIFELPKRRVPARMARKRAGLVGRYKRFYPVATPKEVLKLVIGE